MNKKFKICIIIAIVVLAVLAVATGLFFILNKEQKPTPEFILNKYVSYINEKKYEDMYELLTENSRANISKDDFVKRNKNIYEGIEMQNMRIKEISSEKRENHTIAISYRTTMNTIAGEMDFPILMGLTKNKEGNYEIEWNSGLIFSELTSTDKVRVITSSAKRGKITDRNDKLLAGDGEVYSVGLVPGKMSENKNRDIEKIATLLDTTVDSINNSLGASYVKEDTFVPIKKISKDSQELKEQLLQIKGIMISNVAARTYPLAEAASHLTGYVSSITAEELEKKQGKGYNSNSVIGKTGLENQYEERLKGMDGAEIYIEDKDGNKKSIIGKKEAQNGENIKLTIDSTIQQRLYNELKNDKGLFVVMEPKTGELLALVSTPSYNANDFVLGMGTNKWNSLKDNPSNPMYNRYLQAWCPGSTFKSITGAIGLTTGKLNASDEASYSGNSWQKDSSWGDFKITTLASYGGAKNLKNALIYSDNIFFAQAALKIGREQFEEGLKKIGFGEELNFPVSTQKSQYTNSNGIDTEGLLANSGYGQGQLLVNPIHMAAIYSAFANDGNMIKPYIEYKENGGAEYLKKEVFSKEAANTIKDDLIQVVENQGGTAHDARINGVTIAGKTGTAELKQSQGETGDILSWFNCFTADENSKKQLLVISMVENARSSGGTHYLIGKIRAMIAEQVL